MPANVEPLFAITPRVSTGQVTTANTARNGTGTIVSIMAAGANGTRVDTITIKGTGTTTAGTVRLFISDGTNIRLWREILVTAITASATVAAFVAVVSPRLFSTDTNYADMPLILPTGYSLQASTEKTETFNIIAQGGDF